MSLNIILHATILSFTRLFAPQMRKIFWRILGISAIAMIISWMILRHFFMLHFINWLHQLIDLPVNSTILSFIAAISFSIGISFLIYFILTPLITFIGSFFADDIISFIEKRDFPQLESGHNMQFKDALLFGLRFILISILGYALALLLYFIAPFHLLSFYVINGYILGKTYFFCNALRFHNYANASRLFKQNVTLIFTAGLVIAAVSSLPFINFITPIFAASFMTYIYKSIQGHNLLFIAKK